MTPVSTWLQGKKTYITAWVGIIATLCAWYVGSIDAKTALETIWAALLVIFVRHGIPAKN